MPEILVKLKGLEGNLVRALNYRKKPAAWEAGTIHNVECSFNKEGKPYIGYTVLLARRGKPDRIQPEGKFLFIHVGEKDIEIVE